MIDFDILDRRLSVTDNLLKQKLIPKSSSSF